MKKYQISTTYKRLLADTLTPVSVYLKLRDQYPNSILLESSDYHGAENSFSYICCSPMASIKAENELLTESFPDGTVQQTPITEEVNVPSRLAAFSQSFEVEENGFSFINNGLFGYMNYDAVRYYEDIDLNLRPDRQQIPDLYYAVYRYIIAINHFTNEAYIFSHSYGPADNEGIAQLEALLNSRNIPSYTFNTVGEEAYNISSEDFLKNIEKAMQHCFRGDVFQLVLSRRFEQAFQGDEFNVYRALRSINPSPYLFYFDYGSFKIFGSSPEAQLVIKDKKASIFPIAGTFRRTGDDAADAALAEKLLADPKENAEHVMLVDLARNDLSRNGHSVQVETFREIQFYSHVIHLVSKVSGTLHKQEDSLQMVASTFPAGTLSGAPKHMAMQLIDRYENSNRAFYGGCIGFLDFNGNFNSAIMIRSFLSKDYKLFYQAGAGIVAASKPENELQEVDNKLMALRKALSLAQEIN
ncbi:anthranilate synthase component 1 [Pontibacter ummariensis]|uniref:Anthranilate synthase component 1 n=1 Tax=Pontibacter ummariensis TaxID=1610492 RepID=A0A239BXP5_9BACT|nr:anthranilate synthase component I family protein [Pontibacter ummariensis]PRY15571.1 anthranilate synthase component 1 [Pontibacter ummariensis]SNS12422.1 anthranilate synthase component 1 [Pontibacter ummariensis]